MNIKILQAENSIENVDRSVISALYNAHINGDISLEVDNNNQKVGLVGSITAPAGYAILVSTLNSAYPKFHVTVNSEYISFEDANVELILLNIGLGDGVGITVLAAGNANFTNNTFKNNTTITSFNEFSYFTRANINPVNNLFEGCTNLEEVDLSLATKISEGEFLSSGIKEVYAPSLIEIGLAAFRNSSVETVTSLGNIVSIPFGCFMYCNDLQTVQLPSSVTTISPGAFSILNNGVSSLTYINLNNVTSIDNSAFANCKLLNIDASDLSNLVSIGGETFSSCFSIHGELNMPNLISAGNKCFNSCSRITKVKCLGKITTIPEFFMVKLFSSGMALTEVYLPYECTSILWNGFNGCSALTTIKQYTQSVDNWVNGEPSSYGRITRITAFGNLCFLNCSSLTITTEDIENAVTIGIGAFASSGLTGNINLPNLTSLGQSAFEGCSGITGVLNCPNLTSIGFHAIWGTNISSITNLGSVNTLTEGTLSCSSLTSVTLPSTLRTVSWGFCNGNDNIEKIIFLEGVTDIIDLQPVYRNMKYIEVPSTITSMGACFHRALEHNTANSCFMVIKATTPPDLIFYANWFNVESSGYDLHAFAGIYVPDAALSTYQDTTNLTDDQIGWKVAAVQSKLKPISWLLRDSPTWWAEYLTRV